MTGPPAIVAFKLFPSACEISTDGITIVESTPAMPPGGPPATLLTMIVAIAPASCAFLALMANPHVPRSTTAIFPATAAGFENAERDMPETRKTAVSTAALRRWVIAGDSLSGE